MYALPILQLKRFQVDAQNVDAKTQDWKKVYVMLSKQCQESANVVAAVIVKLLTEDLATVKRCKQASRVIRRMRQEQMLGGGRPPPAPHGSRLSLLMTRQTSEVPPSTSIVDIRVECTHWFEISYT